MARVGLKLLGAAAAMLIAGAGHAAAPGGADRVKTGVDAWEAGNYSKAVEIWKPLAAAGDADAQFNLAQAYRLGRGGPVDMKQAEDWYRKSAAQGHNQAQANYGLLLFQNGNRKEAMPWLEKAANAGDPRAQYVVGTALFNGDQLPKDWTRAYALMTRAAAAGLPPASTSLSEMDRYIPLDQRQKGTAMARELERNAQLASAGEAPIAPPPPVATASIRPTELPPARPAGRPVTKPTVNAPPPVASTPVPPPPARPAPQPMAVAKPAPRPTPLAPAPVATASAGGKWRVQLGAFSNEAAARKQWGTLQGRFGGLQPYFVQAGAVVRLQAGPLASKAAADKACAAARGTACFAAAAP